jgi:hypothetical protein
LGFGHFPGHPFLLTGFPNQCGVWALLLASTTPRHRHMVGNIQAHKVILHNLGYDLIVFSAARVAVDMRPTRHAAAACCRQAITASIASGKPPSTCSGMAVFVVVPSHASHRIRFPHTA